MCARLITREAHCEGSICVSKQRLYFLTFLAVWDAGFSLAIRFSQEEGPTRELWTVRSKKGEESSEIERRGEELQQGALVISCEFVKCLKNR